MEVQETENRKKKKKNQQQTLKRRTNLENSEFPILKLTNEITVI